MFYSVQLLAKKGPLGTVWIAGHLDKRLKRNQIYDTNIASCVGEFKLILVLPERCQRRYPKPISMCSRVHYQPRSTIGVTAVWAAPPRCCQDILPQNHLPVYGLR